MEKVITEGQFLTLRVVTAVSFTNSSTLQLSVFQYTFTKYILYDIFMPKFMPYKVCN
jgi:hypothetical protein